MPSEAELILQNEALRTYLHEAAAIIRRQQRGGQVRACDLLRRIALHLAEAKEAVRTGQAGKPKGKG